MRTAALLALLALVGCASPLAPPTAAMRVFEGCTPGTVVHGYNIWVVTAACDSSVQGTLDYPPPR